MERLVATYSPSDVVFSVGGFTVTGWEDIEVSRTSKGFKEVRGIRGKNTRSKIHDTSATIKINLLQTSYSNDVFSMIHAEDLATGTGRLKISLKDESGAGHVESEEAYITGYPRVIYSGEFEMREWEIHCLSTSVFNVYGNTNRDINIFDTILNKTLDLINED